MVLAFVRLQKPLIIMPVVCVLSEWLWMPIRSDKYNLPREHNNANPYGMDFFSFPPVFLLLTKVREREKKNIGDWFRETGSLWSLEMHVIFWDTKSCRVMVVVRKESHLFISSAALQHHQCRWPEGGTAAITLAEVRWHSGPIKCHQSLRFCPGF